MSHYKREDEANCFGFKFKADKLTDGAYISEIVDKTDAYNIFCCSKISKRKIIGATVTAINDKPIYTVKDVIDELNFLHDKPVDSFKISVSDPLKMTKKGFNEAMMELENIIPEHKNINSIQVQEIYCVQPLDTSS